MRLQIPCELMSMFIACDMAISVGLASWCVAFEPLIGGLRKLRPHVELQFRREQGESLGNGAETKRPPRQAMTHLWCRVRWSGNGETAVLQVERANSRRWRIYRKAQVARLAECHRQQKAGYVQHTSLNKCHNEQKVPESQCTTVLSPSIILSSEALLYWQKVWYAQLAVRR